MTRSFGRTAIRTAALAALLTTGATVAMAAEPPVPSRVAAATATTKIFGGGATLPAVDYSWTTGSYKAEMGLQFGLTPAVDFTYYNNGSGAGRAAFLKNDSTQFKDASGNPLPAGTTVDYGASDAYLNATEATTALPSGGAKIQIPMIGTAVAIPFHLTGATAGTQVILTDAQLCGIFAGTITQWTDAKLKGAVTVKPAPTGQITVAYRSDNSGTTFLLAQHLSAVCGSTSPFASFSTLNAAGNAGKFASYFPSGFPAGSSFSPGSGSGGVATVVLGATNTVGYLSPDYTAINPGSPASAGLLAASVKNAGLPYQPNYLNTSTALSNPGVGATNTTPPSTLAAAQDPTKWVPSVPTPAKGYPIVGFTNWNVATCYSNPKVATGIITFLTNHYFSGTFKTLITTTNGFVPLVPASYATQVKAVFLANTSGFNLNIGNATACAGVTKR